MGIHANGGEEAYSQYIRHLERSSPSVQAVMQAGTVENFAHGYQDYLQAPLQVSILENLSRSIPIFSQPLMDNLPSITYQTFEKDPVKYRNYEEVNMVCIQLLLLTRCRQPIEHCLTGLVMI